MNTSVYDARDLMDIHALLTSNHWDFYLDPTIDERGLAVRNSDYFSDAKNKTLVCRDEIGKLLGFIHFDNVVNSDTNAPSFNVSVDASARGKGVGTQLVKDGVKYIFEKNDKIRRIYATTREDNIPMQKLFESVGFRREARHKKEWKNRETGEFLDAFGYAILKDECTWL